MELISGWTHRAFALDDPSCVGQARRHAAGLAAQLEFGEVEAGRLALVVTELGTNGVRHAQRGRLLLAARPQAGDVEVLAVDDGPGIADLALSLEDGHSSGTTPGTGLGAVRRLASTFDIHSRAPGGTVCVARVAGAPAGAAARPRHGLQVGAVCLPAPGEAVCGDAWAVALDGATAQLLVADGLGHGPAAAGASQAATSVFAEDPCLGLTQMMERIHARLQATRGAAVCVMSIDLANAQLVCTGAGNIAGRVVSGVSDQALATQYGTAGVQLRKPQLHTMDLPEHGVVIVHSDGIDTRWRSEFVRPALRLDPALLAALLLRDHVRQRDDATVVVLRRTG